MNAHAATFGEKAEEERRYLGRCVDNLGENVRTWCNETGEGSSTWDLCKAHAEILDKDPHRYDEVLVPLGTGEPGGEDGRGGDVLHPNYDDWDIRCAIPGCNTLLGGW